MQILKHKTNIDFIGKRRPALFISSILNLSIIVGIAIFKFNWGVDFAGGTVVELKFTHPIAAEDVRRRAQGGGLQDVSVQGLGSASEYSFLLRLGGVTQLTQENGPAAKEALSKLGTVSYFDPDIGNGLLTVHMGEKVDPEQIRVAIEGTGVGVKEVRALGNNEYQVVASGMEKKIFSAMSKGQSGPAQLDAEATTNAEATAKQFGEVTSFQLDAANGVIHVQYKAPVEAVALQRALQDGGLGVREVRALSATQYDVALSDFIEQRVDYVGPQVGEQLRNKGITALVYAMIAILVYVAFRFDFKFGPGALVAMVHDAIMVTGYYLVSRREFNLTSIAVLLTVVGYSINDTIVVYDRIREEMARYKGKPLPEIINIAVNDTLSRTILTSGVTALSLVGLLIFGVGEIWDFAAAMLVGIVVGTYSSVYIASPLTIWLDERQAAKDRQGKKKTTPEGPGRVAAAR
jgi:preprotein translocase subunit SecF